MGTGRRQQQCNEIIFKAFSEVSMVSLEEHPSHAAVHYRCRTHTAQRNKVFDR